MYWLTEPEKWPDFLKKMPIQRSVCMGNFDGVHLGHRALISQATNWAKKNAGVSSVLTFHPHPQTILKSDHPHLRLFDYEDQKAVLQDLGVDAVFIQPFDKSFAELSALEFLEKFLLSTFSPKMVVVGEDFKFGKDRKGDIELLRKFCESKNLNYCFVPAVHFQGERVSTSRIRKTLLNHDPVLAQQLLGRAYYLKGIVERGQQRGRTLGFPTINIKPYLEVIPTAGVYVSRCLINNKIYPSVTNIGLNKTFVEGDRHPLKVESHILGENLELYGCEVKVELLAWIRGEHKFANSDELIIQIKLDVERAIAWHQKSK
jgi:riboflavin kinase / FMN adenylyltransferase